MEAAGARRHDRAMDTFKEGQKVWVEREDGTTDPAIFVGEAAADWFGGPPRCYVVHPETRSGEEVDFMRVMARDED